jgi:translation initiation factor 2B subunit (eIF-2B alpha/beta/delta family)
LSSIAHLVKPATSSDAIPPPAQGPGKTDGPVGGEGEVDSELQQVYNPSFDVTPAALIAAIVTERGVLEKEGGEEVYVLAGSKVVWDGMWIR